MRISTTSNVLKVLNQHLIAYPTPVNLNYMYNWGSLAGIMLSVQIVTGFFLAMHYVPSTSMAFDSVIHLMTDVPSGMILRYAHANGASLFFIVVYMHIFRGMYYSSGNQPRELVWITGVVILLLMIITAFLGYVLPWGQMSFWGATVITSLATVVPIVGKSIVYWLWGGFSLDHPTLNRFYSFHYMLPFLLAALSIFHIAALHQYGSTNPLGVNSSTSSIPFGIYFTSKDFLGFLFLLFVFGVLVFFYPELLGHPDNLIPANPYSTPQHIVPEWYFLWVYAILRSIPNKAMGVVAIALTFASLICLPFFLLSRSSKSELLGRNLLGSTQKFLLSRSSKSELQGPYTLGAPAGQFKNQSPRGLRLISERFYWIFVADVCLLSWLGGQEIMPATVLLGQISTVVLFLYLLIIYPLVPVLENYLYNEQRKTGGPRG